MSHKVHPIGFRLGVNVDWSSRWFDLKNYPQKLREDIAIKAYLVKKLRGAGLEKVEIERTGNKVLVIVNSSRPGLIIGRGGSGTEDLNKSLEKILHKTRVAMREPPASQKLQPASTRRRGERGELPQLRLEIREIRNPEAFASLVGLSIAEQLEKRMPFRRVLKRSIERIMANKEVKGAKIIVSGRLGGAEMARRERIKEGVMPCNTLRSKIDFSVQEAYTTYGVIGIKVWIYKGENI